MTAAVVSPVSNDRITFAVKWVASLIQVPGYTATGFGFTPWNLYLFVVGAVRLKPRAIEWPGCSTSHQHSG